LLLHDQAKSFQKNWCRYLFVILKLSLFLALAKIVVLAGFFAQCKTSGMKNLLSLAAPNLTLVNLTIRFSIGYKSGVLVDFDTNII
jgi:hypothetical protein